MTTSTQTASSIATASQECMGASVNDRRRAELIVERHAQLASRIGGRDEVVRYSTDAIRNRAERGLMDGQYSEAAARALAVGVVDAGGWRQLEGSWAGRQKARDARIAELAAAADEAMRGGDKATALARLQEAEAIDPDGQGPRGHRVSSLVDALTR